MIQIEQLLISIVKCTFITRDSITDVMATLKLMHGTMQYAKYTGYSLIVGVKHVIMFSLCALHVN